MRRTIIACRRQCYAPFLPVAYEHLAGLGVKFVEIPAPPSDQIDAVESDLRRHGLMASTLQVTADLRRGDFEQQVAASLPAFQALGAKLMLLAVQAGETPRETVHGRLRAAGDLLVPRGITMVLETHPDLVTNADVALATMRAVAHDHVRINFDTANVYFYNEDVDGVVELHRVAPYIAAVHLKDTDGGYRQRHFPALGRGIVRFAEVFRELDAAGFAGPCTLEIEGVEGETRTERLVCDRIAESVGYLRGLGRL